MAGRGLTPKQQLFVDSYLENFSATEAAIAAKYSVKTARSQGARLLTKVAVKAAINAAKAKVAKKCQLTAERILADVAEIKSRCMEKEAVLDRQGNETGVWKFDSNGAMKCCEFEAKYIKMFGDGDSGGDTRSFSAAIRSALGRVAGKRTGGGSGGSA